MIKSLLLLFIGILLIFIEFYLPGAVMGALGGLFILISVIVFAQETQSPLLVVAYILVIGVLIYYLVKFALWRIKKAKPERSIYSDSSQVGYIASTFDKSAVGKKGVVLSDLKPGGYILIDGKQHQAISVSGYITKGEEVDVIGGQEESLIVKTHSKG